MTKIRVHLAGRRTVGAVVLLASLAVAACGGGPASPAPTASLGPVVTPAAATAPVSPAASSVVGGVSISAILGVASPPASTTWRRVTDAAAPFSFEVPSEWTGHLAYPWSQGGSTGTVLIAGPDPAKLGSDFGVPGVAVALSGNVAGATARQLVEADTTFSATCTAGPVEEATEEAGTAAYRLWEACAGGQAYVLELAIVPTNGQGLVVILFQGVDASQLGYLDHIVTSIRGEATPATGAPPTAGPASSGGSVSGPTYTISMDVCQNQHGQGVSGGLIRNDDGLIHSYRIVVAFSDPNGVFLNDTGWTTSDLQPGITARWQATVPSGLPAVSVSCQITRVELVR